MGKVATKFRPSLSVRTFLIPIIMASSLAATAFAADSSASSPSTALDEVVVTAQKRSERLQDVPIAVSVLSAESLDDRGITSTSELMNVVPGLSFQQSAHQAVLRIRGVGSNISSGGNESSVATVVDGVYYASGEASNFSFNNISQVEVLKGPQGTLFGRNATGGVLLITTPDPSKTFGGNASLTYGNVDTVIGSAYVTGGVAPGLSADAAVRVDNQGAGFGRNVFNGEYWGTSRDYAARSKWKLDMDGTTARLIVDYDKFTSTYNGFRPMYGRLPAYGIPYTGKPFDIDSYYQPLADIFSGGISLNIDHQFDGMELTSISAYRRTQIDANLNSGLGPLPLLATDVVLPGNQESQEFQLRSTGDSRLNWVVGLFYFRYSDGYKYANVFSTPAFLNFYQHLYSNMVTQSYAAYSQTGYRLSDQTQLTLGVRLTQENKDFSGAGTYTVIDPGFGVPLGPVKGREDIFKPTWRVALDHHFDADLMTYVSYNRGFKSGGFNPTSVSTLVKLEPEQLDAFEVGAKDDLFGHRLRIDAAAFYYDYKDIQLNDFAGGLPSVFNGRSATLYGLDLDAAAQLAHGLTTTLAVGLIHSSFGNFPITETIQLPAGGISKDTIISASGKQVPGTPAVTFDWGFRYTVPIASGSVDVAADYYWSDKFYAYPDNNEEQKSYSLVNASIAWLFGRNESYNLKIWGKNLQNTVYAAQFGPGSVGYQIEVAPGRTFGMTLGCNF